MKKYILMAALLVGCATTPQKNSLDDLGFYTYLASNTGTKVFLLKHPEARPAFEQALQTMQPLLGSQNFDAIAFHQILSSLPIKAFESPEAAIYVSAASIIYHRLGQNVNIDQDERVAVAMSNVYNGIQDALKEP